MPFFVVTVCRELKIITCPWFPLTYVKCLSVFLMWTGEKLTVLRTDSMVTSNFTYFLNRKLKIDVEQLNSLGRVAQSLYSDWLRAEWSGNRIPVGMRFSAPVQTGPGAHPACCIMVIKRFPGVECGRGVTLTPHPFLVPRSKNRLQLYLYSP
jgi:hypothetical protein